MAEFLPGYEAFAWVGFGAPKDTPAAIIETLNEAINAAVADPTIRARLVDLGDLVMPPNTPAEFGKFIAADTGKVAQGGEVRQPQAGVSLICQRKFLDLAAGAERNT
jgi:tripartite-type tricarboxylate transporter receptor subunit TctC